MVASLVAALSIFAVMLQTEKKVLSEYERGEIYTAVKEIPKGTMLDESNVMFYLEKKELDKGLIPSAAVKDPEQLKGLIAVRKIDEGTFLTEGMFDRRDEIAANMQQPVIAGFKADDLYQVAGGVLRPGDRIHIYTVSESGTANLIWREIFVQQVFDGAGSPIGGEDAISSAQRINVYLDAADVEYFYTELARGALRVVKVCE